MEKNIARAAEAVKNAKCVIALTGAGISVESGIPDFRSKGGLWSKYDPNIYASISTFVREPEKCWEMIFETLELTIPAKPNPGHIALAQLEAGGKLDAIITQNIDCLHTKAGSKNVIEFHGSGENLVCLKCDHKANMADYEADRLAHKPPICKCGAVMKPSIIFFGEAIPTDALHDSSRFTEQADVVLVVGTSAVVYPAAAIPMQAKRHGAFIIECNLEETGLSSGITDVFLKGKAGETLPALAAAVLGA